MKTAVIALILSFACFTQAQAFGNASSLQLQAEQPTSNASTPKLQEAVCKGKVYPK